MLQTHNLSKTFGSTRAVQNLDLSVQVGQIRGLLGPNGAGKSTTIRMICGVLAPTSGSIQIGGENISLNPTVAKQFIGYVPEGAPLPLELLPIEYLKHSATMYGLYGDERMKAIGSWAERCDIENVLRKPIGSLSRGYRQRLALAAALVHNPKLIVLDEPSTGLDPEQGASFRTLLKEVAEHAAVMYSSHHLAEVEVTCDVVSIINHGMLIHEGDFQSLYSGETSLTVEVSPHAVVEELPCANIEFIDERWARCTVDSLQGEQVVSKVTGANGKVRLLHPLEESIESNYLRIIRVSEKQS
jgi:ABC-2 type transport system ATP-binding protein